MTIAPHLLWSPGGEGGEELLLGKWCVLRGGVVLAYLTFAGCEVVYMAGFD